MRAVPIPAWTRVLIDPWALLAGLADGRVFRALRRSDHLTDSQGMSPDAIADVVFAYAAPLELDVAAHDCRRTFAKLALKGGARPSSCSSWTVSVH